MRLNLLVLSALAGLMVAATAPAAEAKLSEATTLKADLVVVYKHKRTLQLKREGEVISTYHVALGPAPEGHKRMEGDGRTPEGVYTLDWRNPESSFYRSIHISYPDSRDLSHAERWGVSPGGLIMLHGLPNGIARPETVGHPARDWTNGCIALTNEEMDEIWARVDDGTPIIIYP